MGARGTGAAAALLGVVTLVAPLRAEVRAPAGFTLQPYVTGEGYEAGSARGAPGFPSTSTMTVDGDGALYLARTGRRYLGGEVDDLFPVLRIPPGGGRLHPDTEVAYRYGPPLRNPQVAAVRGDHEVLVTTYDRDRQLGALYRLGDGRVELLAGGTPPRGTRPLFRQPEGAAVGPGGAIFVADRQQGTVIRLDPGGRLLDPALLRVSRPRLLALDPSGALWIGADGDAEAPWQAGPGEIWRLGPDGRATLVLRGPVAQGFAQSPGGHLFVADRHGARVFVLGPEGQSLDVLAFTDGDAPRTLAFVPVTPRTHRAGLAGDLLVVVLRRGAWPVNEVLRVSGPFDELVRERLGR